MSMTYYTKEHEWARIDGDVATVGITSYAARQLGDITFVELPPVGKTVKQSDVLCTVESVKAAADIYAPLSGTVISVNEELTRRPELLNASAEDAGWLVTLKPSDLSETAKLMDRDRYDEYQKES